MALDFKDQVNWKTYETFKGLCKIILREAQGGSRALNYVTGYARAGTFMSYPTNEAIRAQVLYILNNIPHWRGPVATQVRKSLKELEKELRP